VRRCVLEKGT